MALLGQSSITARSSPVWAVPQERRQWHDTLIFIGVLVEGLHNRPLYVATLHNRITEISLFPCCLLLNEVAKSKGRVALTTNMVIGGTVTDDSSDEWLVLDQKVNTYPTDRGFTAIGTGGEDFVHSMVDAVESVLQESIPKGQVSQKISSRGKYVSVKIGPIRVASSEQVQAVYRAMRRDNRMKYFL
ncbi:unnamed protein product [Triticum turgidum subsp. durum]|uniref:Uncharacterized protein n=1 Tax=Triticum turgidum subsp. durum TaxID=4567 RepID=A0A9R1PQA7_TRITD|nr:unnamed protein product [Triticum turgidum subsp. durum]